MDVIDPMDLTNIYEVFHPATEPHTFFSVAHGTFYKIHHILAHKASI
jgi:hypothetical protein